MQSHTTLFAKFVLFQNIKCCHENVRFYVMGLLMLSLNEITNVDFLGFNF